jgi:hypothetical protein
MRKLMVRIFCTSLTLPLALLLSCSLCAQTGTTSLHGSIMDKSGAVIVGANIKLTKTDQGLEYQTTSNTHGEYQFVLLTPGTYSLLVQADGFRKFEQRNIELLVNNPTTDNITLEVGSTTQTVEVSAQAETLNTTDASLGIAFGEYQIKELPMEGRNVPDLLSLQAGVAYTGNRSDINLNTDTRSGAVNGARSDQSNITLDGVDVNTDTKGYAFQSVLPITADSVQEFRVTTTNYNADEGRSSGAQVALVTKSGTNDFHGSLYEYHRNTISSANDYFVKLAQQESCVSSGTPLNDSQCNSAPKLIRNIFGGSLGGPIKKDRLFFFANYEGSRQAEQQSVVRIVPSDAMRDGVITYLCQTNPDGSLNPTSCPGGAVKGVNGSHTIQPGYYGLTPQQITNMDPLFTNPPPGYTGSVGPSPVMLPYFNTFPHSNDNSVGDGVNFQGYRFKGPVSINDNWYIARVDYKITSNGNHALFWRGGLRNDTDAGVPYFPGGASELTTVNYSKGFTVGYAAVLRPTLINNLRYGYTRESLGEIGNQNTQIIFFRGLNDNSTPNNSSLAVTNSLDYQVPVNNFVDDISWIRGKHTLQFGANISILRNPQSSNVNSFSSATTNASWFDTAALANTGVPGHFDPAFAGLPAVDSSFGNNYDYPMIALVGMISQVNAQYNFNHSGQPLGEAVPVTRRFADNSYEMYAQDSWKLKPNLTLTYGLRYSLFSPPWETNGLQVVPNVNLTNWFNARGAGMLQGIPSNAAPDISFNFGGPANNGPPFYNWDYKDLGPRVAFAWSPKPSGGLLRDVFGDGRTSIRGGFGMVYDRLGPALLATFDANGSFGLSSNLVNIGGTETPATAPRITGLTGMNNIPTVDLAGNQMFASAPPGTFPQTFPSGSQTGAYAVYWGMDSALKTPYSYTIDLAVARELHHDYTLEVAYVGRLSHRLLSQEDVAAPLDYVDPATHMDYYTAVQALAKVYRQGIHSQNVTDSMFGTAARYWADIYPNAPAGGFRIHRCTGTDSSGSAINYGSPDPVVAAYDLFCGFRNNETTAVQGIDQGFGIEDINGNSLYPKTGPYTFVDSQFAALYSWRSIGAAAYHAMQVTFRKRMTHGLQFDFNYTFSKSLDISSDANRITAEGGLGGQVINPWNPTALRAVSDFDAAHQFNANWIFELPFGKGRWIAGDAHGLVEAIIGGWQLTGLGRLTSGFPIGVGNGAQWPTNWQLSGYATQIGPVKTVGASKNPDGTVNIFGNGAAAATALASYSPDLPGLVGARNTLRGDGFAGLDLGLDKKWQMPWKESHILQFRWEVFNALNLTRFDVQSLNLSITNATNFGNYTGLLTNPRVMQFALRYEF